LRNPGPFSAVACEARRTAATFAARKVCPSLACSAGDMDRPGKVSVDVSAWLTFTYRGTRGKRLTLLKAAVEKRMFGRRVTVIAAVGRIRPD